MKTPYFMIDESKIQKNCKVLERVRREAGCKILLAQKAFSCYDTYPLMAKYLDGTTASGLFEARLGKEKFGKEVHVFAPAFTDKDIIELVKICGHIVFNSKAQLLKHHAICRGAGVEISVRVNPECKTQDTDIYDPCAPFSRFGIKAADMDDEIISLVDGLHFHTLCEQGLEPLRKTLAVFETKFGKYLSKIKTVNFGGGHHVTRDDYDVDGLISLIKAFKAKYNNIQVYLEPGEAVVLDAGFLHASVLDIVRNVKDTLVLDTSAACHNPDILETQHTYTPEILGAGMGKFEYRLAGNTCLAGDVIGDYCFNRPVKIGDEIIFTNAALYTIVKTNMFNGINLPSLYVKRLDGNVELLREFGYSDYISRLGRIK